MTCAGTDQKPLKVRGLWHTPHLGPHSQLEFPCGAEQPLWASPGSAPAQSLGSIDPTCRSPHQLRAHCVRAICKAAHDCHFVSPHYIDGCQLQVLQFSPNRPVWPWEDWELNLDQHPCFADIPTVLLGWLLLEAKEYRSVPSGPSHSIPQPSQHLCPPGLPPEPWWQSTGEPEFSVRGTPTSPFPRPHMRGC